MKNIPDGVDINTLCPVGKSVFLDAEEELDKLVKDDPCFTFIGDLEPWEIKGKSSIRAPTIEGA